MGGYKVDERSSTRGIIVVVNTQYSTVLLLLAMLKFLPSLEHLAYNPHRPTSPFGHEPSFCYMIGVLRNLSVLISGAIQLNKGSSSDTSY